MAFYCGVLGFTLMQRFGDSAAFISAGGYHHHIGLNTWHSKGAGPGPVRAGLYHLAILYPTRAELADALRRLMAAGIALDGTADHGVSEALYLRTQTEMAWNCIGIGRANNGRWMKKDNWQWSASRWIWGICWPPSGKWQERRRRAEPNRRSKKLRPVFRPVL